MRRNETGRRPRRSEGEQSLEEKLQELRRIGKQKAAHMRRRDEEMFMTPGQKRRASIRRGRERATRDKRQPSGY
jgi:hypothetical protein